MVRGTRGVWLAVLPALVVLALSKPAAAVPAPPDPSVYFGLYETRIPVGGVIVGRLLVEVPILVKDSEGNEVSGQRIPLPGDSSLYGSIFVPEEALAVGEYTVEAEIDYGAQERFEVVELPQDTFDWSIRLTPTDSSYGSSVGCEQYVREGLQAAFFEQTLHWVALNVDYGLGDSLLASQYQFALVHQGQEPAIFAPYLGSLVPQEDNGEVCYDLYARAYRDQSIELLESGCLSTDDFFLGVVDEVRGNFEGTLELCVVPPEGYEDAWCDLFSSAFAARSCAEFELDSCFAARTACSEGDHPSAEEEEEERAELEGAGENGSGGQGGLGLDGSGGVATVGGSAAAGAGAQGADDRAEGSGQEAAAGGSSSGSGGNAAGCSWSQPTYRRATGSLALWGLVLALSFRMRGGRRRGLLRLLRD